MGGAGQIATPEEGGWQIFRFQGAFQVKGLGDSSTAEPPLIRSLKPLGIILYGGRRLRRIVKGGQAGSGRISRSLSYVPHKLVRCSVHAQHIGR